MQLDNDLLGLWLKAGTLTKEEIRFLIETIQTLRNENRRGFAFTDGIVHRMNARLGEIATRP